MTMTKEKKTKAAGLFIPAKHHRDQATPACCAPFRTARGLLGTRAEYFPLIRMRERLLVSVSSDCGALVQTKQACAGDLLDELLPVNAA